MPLHIWAPASEFVSSSTPSWQILTAHAQPFRGARDLAFCLKVPLDSLPVWASSGGSAETARMRRLAWTLAARIGDKYQIRLTRPIYLLVCLLTCLSAVQSDPVYQTSSPTGRLRMLDWSMSLRRKKRAIISWDGSNMIFRSHGVDWYSVATA